MKILLSEKEILEAITIYDRDKNPDMAKYDDAMVAIIPTTSRISRGHLQLKIEATVEFNNK